MNNNVVNKLQYHKHSLIAYQFRMYHKDQLLPLLMDHSLSALYPKWQNPNLDTRQNKFKQKFANLRDSDFNVPSRLGKNHKISLVNLVRIFQTSDMCAF